MTPAIPAAEIAAMKLRCEAVSDGYWYLSDGLDHAFSVRSRLGSICDDLPVPICDIIAEREQGAADGQFIAHARTDMPRLLSEREGWAEMVKAVEAYVAALDERRALPPLREYCFCVECSVWMPRGHREAGDHEEWCSWTARPFRTRAELASAEQALRAAIPQAGQGRAP